MADENTPAFYPRVGNIRRKDFKPAKPMPFIDDERAMELPDYKEFIPKLGTVDLSVPSKENRELNRRITERDADLMRQVQADRSPLEKLAGGLQAGRFLGSALTQGINAIPTQLFSEGTKAERETKAEKFIQDRLYKPEQPLAYEYAGDVGDFLEKLETQYKLPPILPEAVALQYLTGPATSQAMRTAGKGAEQAGRAIERGMEPVVKGALERGGLPREIVMAMGANTQSNVMKPSNKANWMSGPNIHVPEGDAWRFKTQTVAGETPAQRIPRHEELLNDPTLNQDQIDRVLYQLEQTKGEAALDKWADNALMGYFKGQLASPEDPVRLMIERNYANIEAKFAKDQERATKMAQRAEAEIDPRKQANMKRQADTMFVQARDDRDVAMQNISHLPSEMLQDIVVDPKSYIKEERVKAGYPAEGLGTTTPSRKWEHQADEAVKVTRAGDIQAVMDLQPKIDQALQDQLAVYQKINKEWGNLLREKGLDEKSVDTLIHSMPRDQKADAVGMLSELQTADSNYLRLLDQDRSFANFASKNNPFVAKLDPETKMYSGYMGDLGFEHVMDVLRQDLAAERIRPEQLNKLSVEQAVKRTQEYNLDLARKMNSDRASARANLPVYKDYPDGYKWVQLNQPGNFAAESQAMGHSVKGYEPRKGDPDWVEGSGDEGSPMYGHGGWDAIKSGRAKIYSLVDSRGAPHATIEIKTSDTASANDFRNAGLDYNEAMVEAKRRMGITPENQKEWVQKANSEQRAQASKDLYKYIDDIYKEQTGDMPQTITQIKGKGNNKPISDYIPYVQDFVRSGKWNDVGDFNNTNLISADQIRKAGWDMKGNTQKYFTWQEFEDLKNAEQKRVEGDGMKAGGKVSISNNPDTMMLELGNRRMKAGGVVRMAGGGDPSKRLSGNILAGASWNSLNQTLGNQLTQLNGMPTFNTSVGGATTADTYKQLMDFIDSGGSFDPNAIVYLQTGGVDFLNGVPKDQIANNIDQILTILENQGVDVVLTGAPFATSMNDVVSNNFDPTMDPLFQEVASKHQNVALVGSMGDILQDKSLLSDNLHTNEQGTQRYNNDVIGALAQFTQPNQNTVNTVNTPNTVITDNATTNLDQSNTLQGGLATSAITPATTPTTQTQVLGDAVTTPVTSDTSDTSATLSTPVTSSPLSNVATAQTLTTPAVSSTPDYSRAYDALGGADTVNNLRDQFLGMGMDEDTIGSVFSKYYSQDNPTELKKGGEVHMAKGGLKGALNIGLKAARPAISEAERALPLRLPRAMPKSNAEINAHAERVARQMLGEHVTSGKAKDTNNLAGRSLKESKRVKALEYEFAPTKDVPESQVYQPRIGDINVALGGDFTLSDVELKSLMGEPINSRQEGGSRYGLGHLEDELPLFYASNEVPAQAVQNKVTDLYDLYGPRRIMGHHMAMGPAATNFAQHFADANLKYTDYTKLRAQDMYDFDKIISEGFVTSKKDKKTGETVYKIVDFPNWPGIADPQAAHDAMKENSEMRKWYNRVMQTPKLTKPLNFPSGQDVRYAITSPDLRDMEVNLTGHGVGELVPNVDLTDTANHNTYRKGIRGLYEGHQEVLSPFAISFPDATQHIITHQRPSDFTGTIQKVFPHQRVDQQFIDEMEQYRKRIKELTGKKKGGAVKKAEGGYLKKPAAYINGDEFVNAAKKYGIKDSMNNLNKIVDLVNKGLSVDDAARQVADTGMHKAAGGAIRGDDLILEERPL